MGSREKGGKYCCGNLGDGEYNNLIIHRKALCTILVGFPEGCR
jgi:hypothetical protein